jgi:hypothetical protein
MIVRILTDNQYRLDDQHGTQLNQLDEQLVAAMAANDSERFGEALQQVIALVHESGTLVGMEEVLPSNIIVPAPDMSLDEARFLLHHVETHPSTPTGEQQS